MMAMTKQRAVQRYVRLLIQTDADSSKRTKSRAGIRERLGREMIWVSMLILLGGCSSQSSPARFAAPVVVIDAHTHLFNAKYLPVREIVVAQTGCPPLAAQAIESVVLFLTRDSRLADPKGATVPPDDPKPEVRLLKSLLGKSPAQVRAILLEEVFQKRLSPEVIQHQLPSDQQAALKLFVRGRDVMSSPDEAARPLGPEDIVKALEMTRFMAERHAEQSDENGVGAPGLLTLLYIAMCSERGILEGLQGTYPQVQLFVHHMMDLAVTYNECPTFPFKQQVVKMLALQDKYPGQVLTFGAYDPFRREDALPTAEDFYRQGVIGFKFYPPDGYRPNQNFIPSRSMPGTVIEQWDRRYQGLDPLKMDTNNEHFFAFCEAHDIPIFVHCSPGGFEAVTNYGDLMADPSYWTNVLATHTNLRVCFGHSGGPSLWFNQPPDTNSAESIRFGHEVIDLCARYKNVYCDSAYWELLLANGGVGKLAAQLPSLIQTYPELAKKLVYGSDWFMISQEDKYQTYLDGMLSALEHPAGNVPANWQQFIYDFFAGNEARYLNLDKLSKDDRLDLDVRQKLRDLVKRLPVGWQD
jgi:predicted TIM-barrel fold metal-dependent hydrolase